VDLLPLTPPPTAASIAVLRSRTTQEQAVDLFARGLAGGIRRLARGPLRSIAEIYVPFRLFDVQVRRGSTHERAVMGLDAVAGVLDLYGFDRYPDEVDLVNVVTRNRLNAAVPVGTARDVLAARMRRLTFQRFGFLATRPLHVEAEPFDALVHVPYWVGFFGRADTASLVVIDAVRRQIEGAKLRRLIGDFLRQ
jgi:hypothetical protein